MPVPELGALQGKPEDLLSPGCEGLIGRIKNDLGTFGERLQRPS